MSITAGGRVLLASLILILAADAVLAQKPGKGGGKQPAPEPTPPPASPVKYRLVRLGEVHGGVGSMTGHLVTGAVSGDLFVYDVNIDRYYWLNDTNQDTEYDADLSQMRLAAGLTLASAYLNTRGQLAGRAFSDSEDPWNTSVAYRFTPAVRDDQGDVVIPAEFLIVDAEHAGDPTASHFQLLDLNEDGDVTGIYRINNPDGTFSSRGFIFSTHVDPDTGKVADRFVDVGSLGLGGAHTAELSSRDGSGILQVTGFSAVSDSVSRAFLYTYDSVSGTGYMEDMGTLKTPTVRGKKIIDDGRSRGDGINDLGDVVGWSDVDGSGEHGFVSWQGGAMQDLGTFGGSQSHAFAINSYGMIVGRSRLADESWRAFIYMDGTMYDLAAGIVEYPDGIDIGGLFYTNRINDEGWIGGTLDSVPILLLPIESAGG